MKTIYLLKSAACLIVLFTIGCTSTLPKPDRPAGSWAESDFVMERITQAMLDSKPGVLCPAYSNVSHMKFWDVLVKAMVGAESGFKPDSWMREAQGIDPVTGEITKSEGYLQLSYKDTVHQYYRVLPAVQQISWEKKNIRDPHVNLAAGLAIMDERIRRTGPDVITALGPYWSVIQEGKWQAKLLPNLQSWMKECF